VAAVSAYGARSNRSRCAQFGSDLHTLRVATLPCMCTPVQLGEGGVVAALSKHR
jgi:hypothetical protein